jgi:hypothetical protein
MLVAKAQEFGRRVGELTYDPDHAERFFRALKSYGPIMRAAFQGRNAYQRQFVEAYRVVAGIADHLHTAEFRDALSRYSGTPKGGSRDPEFLVLRLIFDYGADAQGLEGDEHRRALTNGYKTASRDAAAVRYLLSEGITPPAAAALFRQPGEGLKAWAARAPARNVKKAAHPRLSASRPEPTSSEPPEGLDGVYVTDFPCTNAIDRKQDLVGILQVDRQGQVLGFRSFGPCARFLEPNGATLLKEELERMPLKQ